MTCLRRSLVLQNELHRQGVETQLQFGVRRAGEALEAHAWIEHGGFPVLEREDPHTAYRALERSEGISADDDRRPSEP